MHPSKKLLTFTAFLCFVLTLAFAPQAGAKVIKGTSGKDTLTGTSKADKIDGKAGNDKILGKSGNDVLTGGKGRDRIDGGAGDDTIKAKDGEKDTIKCGSGKDKVSFDSIDKLSADCELPPAPTGPTPPSPAPATSGVLAVTTSGNGSIASSPAGINCGSACAASFTLGTTVTLTATPNAENIFVGWGGACSGTGACVVTVDTAKSVSAAFVPIYLITAQTSGTGSGSISSSTGGISCPSDCSESVSGGDSITLTATPNNGSTFSGWSGGGCSGTGTCVVSPSAATTVTADFSLNNYSFTVTKGGTGSGTVTSSPAAINCGVVCAGSVTYGTTLMLTASPQAGSYFSGWTGGGCSGTGTCVVAVTSATTVMASFNTNTYPLSTTVTGSGTITSSPAGINCGVDCSEPYAAGSMVALTASAGVGFIFAGWTGPCSGTGPCFVTMTSAQDLYATFVPVG